MFVTGLIAPFCVNLRLNFSLGSKHGGPRLGRPTIILACPDGKERDCLRRVAADESEKSYETSWSLNGRILPHFCHADRRD
jgi:hypothetical protein